MLSRANGVPIWPRVAQVWRTTGGSFQPKTTKSSPAAQESTSGLVTMACQHLGGPYGPPPASPDVLPAKRRRRSDCRSGIRKAIDRRQGSRRRTSAGCGTRPARAGRPAARHRPGCCDTRPGRTRRLTPGEGVGAGPPGSRGRCWPTMPANNVRKTRNAAPALDRGLCRLIEEQGRHRDPIEQPVGVPKEARRGEVPAAERGAKGDQRKQRDERVEDYHPGQYLRAGADRQLSGPCLKCRIGGRLAKASTRRPIQETRRFFLSRRAPELSRVASQRCSRQQPQQPTLSQSTLRC